MFLPQISPLSNPCFHCHQINLCKAQVRLYFFHLKYVQWILAAVFGLPLQTTLYPFLPALCPKSQSAWRSSVSSPALWLVVHFQKCRALEVSEVRVYISWHPYVMDISQPQLKAFHFLFFPCQSHILLIISTEIFSVLSCITLCIRYILCIWYCITIAELQYGSSQEPWITVWRLEHLLIRNAPYRLYMSEK